MRRVLVTGSRDWSDYPTLLNELIEAMDEEDALVVPNPNCVVIHGGAAGADSMVARACARLNVPTEVFHADWDRYGKRAGFIRNKEMVDAGADVCLAFIRNNSKGATMCANLAKKAGIPVKYFRQDDLHE